MHEVIVTCSSLSDDPDSDYDRGRGEAPKPRGGAVALLASPSPAPDSDDSCPGTWSKRAQQWTPSDRGPTVHEPEPEP